MPPTRAFFRRVTERLDGKGYLWGVAMPPGVAVGPPTVVEMWWQAQARGSGVCPSPLTKLVNEISFGKNKNKNKKRK